MDRRSEVTDFLTLHIIGNHSINRTSVRHLVEVICEELDVKNVTSEDLNNLVNDTLASKYNQPELLVFIVIQRMNTHLLIRIQSIATSETICSYCNSWRRC